MITKVEKNEWYAAKLELISHLKDCFRWCDDMMDDESATKCFDLLVQLESIVYTEKKRLNY